MLKKFFSKLFSPINRWQFLIALILYFVTSNLIHQYGMFLLYNTKPCISIAQCDLILFEIFMLFVIKRFVDITGSLKKGIISTLILGGIWIVIVFTSFNNQHLSNFYTLFCRLYVIFILYLLFKKGKFSEFKMKTKIFLFRALIIGVFIFAINQFCSNYQYFSGIVDYTMYPSLCISDMVITQKISKNTNLKRGDVVSFEQNIIDSYTGKSQNKTRLLRIIGLPGETIELKNNKIYINNELFEDKYAYFSKNLKPVEFDSIFILNNNTYLLIGDNRYYQPAYYFDNEIEQKVYTNDLETLVQIKREELLGKVVSVNYFMWNDYTPNAIKNNRKMKGFYLIRKNSYLKHNPWEKLSNKF